MILFFCFELFVQNILFYIKETDLSIFLEFHKLPISEIYSHINSMGMSLKPSKCRSFSLVKGKPTCVDFYIGEHLVPSILHEEQKFLGKLQFFHGKSQNTFEHLRDTFKEKLDNIDNLLIRNEQKMWIYQHYFLPSIKFLLTVHEMTQTHVRELDAFTRVYLKRWSGLPPSATNLVLHMKVGLNINSIETLYHTCHSLTHSDMRIKGDRIVNATLDNAIQRESEWTQKKSTVIASEAVHTHAMNTTCLNGELPLFQDETCDKEKAKLTHKIKASVKSKVYSDCLEKQKSHSDTL